MFNLSISIFVNTVISNLDVHNVIKTRCLGAQCGSRGRGAPCGSRGCG